jgi:hypothetical protein
MFSLRAQKSNKIIQSGDIVVIKGNNSPLAKPILTQVLCFYFASRAVNVLFASVALTSALLKSGKPLQNILANYGQHKSSEYSVTQSQAEARDYLKLHLLLLQVRSGRRVLPVPLPPRTHLHPHLHVCPKVNHLSIQRLF